MNNGVIKYIEVAPGMIRIEPSIDGLFTLDKYLDIARSLLEKRDNEEFNLKDEGSADLTDSLLLYNEFRKKRTKVVKDVVFSINGKDYIVNSNNIDRMIQKRNSPGLNKNIIAIRDAVEELQETFR